MKFNSYKQQKLSVGQGSILLFFRSTVKTNPVLNDRIMDGRGYHFFELFMTLFTCNITRHIKSLGKNQKWIELDLIFLFS